MIAARGCGTLRSLLMKIGPHEWRNAALALAALFVVLVAPLFARRAVIHPDDGRAALGLEQQAVANNIGQRRLGDTSYYYVPEEHHHLHGDRTGWIAVWNPHTELGRPSSHLAGVSPAYLPTRVLGWFVDDAFWFHTLLSLATIAGTAAFQFLFLRAMGLSPWSCFTGAAGIGFGIFAIYWAPFPIFVAGLCWTSACLWLTTRWLQRPSLAVGVGLAFAVQALLLSAYPQQIVWHAWFVAPFALVRWWRTKPRSLPALLGLGVCAALGLAAAAPVYVDLAIAATRSARLGVDTEFLMASLPRIGSVQDVLRIFAVMVDPFLATDPLGAPRGSEFNGTSLAPIHAGLVGLAFLPEARRRAGPWLAFVAVSLVLTLWPQAYRFGVEYLGLSLSRFRPQAAALIPLSVVGAIGLDALIRSRARPPFVPLLLVLAPIGFSALLPRHDATFVRWLAIALAGVGLSAFVLFRWRALLPVLALFAMLGWSTPLLVSIPRAAIAESSPLVETLRERTGDGSRYALASERPEAILSPNLEARLGLRSVHAYDSLSSGGYRAWCASVSRVGAQLYGRWFENISGTEGFERPAFARAGVGVVVARQPIASPALIADGRVGPWFLHRTMLAPVLAAHVLDADPEQLTVGEVTLDGTVQSRRLGVLELVERRDDRMRIRLEPRGEPSLVFFSRQHHPHWIARDSNGDHLSTVVVDGSFLGVVAPGGCRELEIHFEPWARFAWIPQAMFALAFLAITARSLLRRRIFST